MRVCVWVLAALAVACGGRATHNGVMGFTGGVAAQPVMTDVYRIQTMQDFVLLNAAEATLAATL
jgi:hypothetical protein